MNKKILLLGIVFLLPLVLAQGVDFQNKISDDLGLVWDTFSYNNVNNDIYNIFSYFFIFENNGYYNDSIFYTNEDKLSGIIYTDSLDNCLFVDYNGVGSDNYLLKLKNYNEFSYRLDTTLNDENLKVVCNENIISTRVVYNEDLKVPIYDVQPESTNSNLFQVSFYSYIDLDVGDCVLTDINDVKYYFTKETNTGKYFSQDFSFSDKDEFKFKLKCSKENYKDFTKGYYGNNFNDDEEWIITFDNELNINLLNLTYINQDGDIVYYDLLDQKFETPYVGDEIIVDTKNISLVLNINESGYVKIKNLYYNPLEKQVSFNNETLKYDFLIGNYFLGDNYVNSNQLEFEIYDIAKNNELKSYKILYESENSDIVVDDIEGIIYGDFVAVIENVENLDESSFKINSDSYSLGNCYEINLGKDKKCDVNMSSYSLNKIDDFNLSVDFLNGSKILKTYKWIKNRYNFSYDVLDYNRLSNGMLLFQNSLPIKFSYDKIEDKDYEIIITNNFNDELSTSINYNSNFINNQLDKVVSSINYDVEDGFNFLTIKFLVDKIEEYEFEYVFYSVSNLNYEINKVSFNSEVGSLFDVDDFNDEYSLCGNGICELENCYEDCGKNVIENSNIESVNYNYNMSETKHTLSFMENSENYDLNILLFTSNDEAKEDFEKRVFDNFKIINNSVLFSYNDNLFYLSNNYVIEFDDFNDDLSDLSFLNFLLEEFPSSSIVEYENINESNKYFGSVFEIPKKYNDCLNLEKIQVFGFGNIFYSDYLKDLDGKEVDPSWKIGNFNRLYGENIMYYRYNDEMVYLVCEDTCDTNVLREYYVNNLNIE